MDFEDIREIIKIQLTDIEIDPQYSHYLKAFVFYQKNNYLPNIDEIISDNYEIIDDDDDDSSNNGDNLSDNDNLRHNNDNLSDDDDNLSHNNDNLNDNDDNLNDDNDSSNDTDDDNHYDNTFSIVEQRYDIELSSSTDSSSIINPNNMLDVLKVVKNIDEIPLSMYKLYINSSSNTQCFICYDPFVPTDIIRILPCTHILHRCCIDDYFLNNSHRCPACTESVVDNYIYKNL